MSRAATEPPPLSTPDLRRIILEQSKRAHVGHIGSALSIVEILAALVGSSKGPNTECLVNWLREDRSRLELYESKQALER